MGKGLRLGVLASGRGSDLQSLIDAAAEGRIASRVVVVISDDPGAKALARARDNKVLAEAIPPPIEGATDARRRAHDARIAEALDRNRVDLAVLAGYMRILTPDLVRKYYGRLINIHPALLPSFPGTHGQRQALERGARLSGCTTHYVDEQVDHGPILLQAALPVTDQDTEETLSKRILAVEHQLLPRSVHLIEQGRAKIEGHRVRLDPDESWTRKYPTLPGVLYGHGY